MYTPIHKTSSKTILSLVFMMSSLTLMAANLSGVIKDQTGSPIEGASVSIFKVQGVSFETIASSIIVGADGRYSETVDDANYVVRATLNIDETVLAGEPYQSMAQTEDFTVTGDTERDISFNFVLLSGKTLDENGLGIANVEIETSLSWNGPETGSNGNISQYTVIHLNGSTLSDSAGNFEMLLFSSDDCITSGFHPSEADCYYDISFKPPAESGFSDVTESAYRLSTIQAM
ncbi:MAG: carboxypeptidase regulatory-like domain-containing protein, partial [Gammaproteobacteria bacterium]|nr:carboxypeptidase regulatory-like domain-containing protein [Gammaproteobacteria bacterium]